MQLNYSSSHIQACKRFALMRQKKKKEKLFSFAIIELIKSIFYQKKLSIITVNNYPT